MLRGYEKFKNKMPDYPNTSDNRISEWVDLFEDLYLKNINIPRKRRLWRNPFLFVFNLFL